MSPNKFNVHPQLVADSHELFMWKSCHLRLHKNATLPWLIIIPQTTEIEFHDLPNELQSEITQVSRVVGDYFKKALVAEKINFAAIGNVVRQLHIHVIGRNRQDPLWPEVVWGQELPEKTYDNEQFKILVDTLKTCLTSLNKAN